MSLRGGCAKRPDDAISCFKRYFNSIGGCFTATELEQRFATTSMLMLTPPSSAAISEGILRRGRRKEQFSGGSQRHQFIIGNHGTNDAKARTRVNFDQHLCLQTFFRLPFLLLLHFFYLHFFFYPRFFFCLLPPAALCSLPYWGRMPQHSWKIWEP